MKNYELQKMIERNNQNHCETWKRVGDSFSFEPLMSFLVEGHRIINIKTGDEIIRFEYGMLKKYKKAAV